MTLPRPKRRCLPVAAAAALAATMSAWASAAAGQDARQALLERVFGQAARLDPKRVAQVKALPPGKPLRVDRDGDGRVDIARL